MQSLDVTGPSLKDFARFVPGLDFVNLVRRVSCTRGFGCALRRHQLRAPGLQRPRRDADQPLAIDGIKDKNTGRQASVNGGARWTSLL